MARLLIIDDDTSVRQLLQRYLQQQGHSVQTAASGAAALPLLSSFNPDLVILDLNLPDTSGYELCAQIQQQHPQAGILILTSRITPSDRLKGFHQGADDYLTKPFNLPELAARIQAILKRHRPSPPPTPLQLGSLVLDPVQRQATQQGTPIPLTALEFDLLLTMAQQPGRVWRRSELIAALWQDDSDERIVDVHIGQIRKKLERDPSQPQWILTVRGVGYRLAIPPTPAAE
ncbi:MAG: response regulator transcription factor [Thermostichales cyanobacterium SZTDM-1c_bins_54]